MATEPAPKPTHSKTVKLQLFKLGLAALFILIIAFGLLGGTFGTATSFVEVSKGEHYSLPIHPAFTQSQTATPSPTFLGLSDAAPPQNSSSSSSSSSATASTSGQIYINFDIFPSGAPVPTSTAITNQYPPAVFSSDFNHYPIADNQFWNTSYPNLLGRAPVSGFYNGTGYAPLYVAFTSPVNDLRFYVAAIDELRQGIAQINIFQNHRLTATRSIDGNGNVSQPRLVDVGAMGFNNITRIEIVNINDYKGVGFDDFSFTIAPTPSPTPTPQPTPAAPTSLSANGYGSTSPAHLDGLLRSDRVLREALYYERRPFHDSGCASKLTIFGSHPKRRHHLFLCHFSFQLCWWRERKFKSGNCVNSICLRRIPSVKSSAYSITKRRQRLGSDC